MNEPFGRCVALALLSAFFLVAARPAVSIIVSATAFPGALDAWTEAAFAQAPGDDDGDGDDDDDGGGGGPGPGPGPDGPAAGPGGLPSTFDDDGFAALPPDCFEEALLRPSWLEDCEPIRRRAIAPPVIAVTPPRAAPAARRSPARFSPGQLDGGLTAEQDEALPREIVLLNASEADIAALVARGFVVLSRTDEALLGANLVRFRVPNDLSTSEGLAVARQIAQSAIADLNHIYRPGQEVGPVASPPASQGARNGVCTSVACRQRALIAWPQAPNVCDVAATIGLIDTRIDIDTPALTGQRIEIINGITSGRARSNPAHGTAIAALLAGRADSAVAGLLPSARLIVIEAFHLRADGADIADTFDIVRAIDTMLRRQVPVVNLSFTGPANELLAEAVRIAATRNVALVASAGNKGPRSGPLYPAAYEGAVAVTAVSDALRIYAKANRGNFVDLAGPGVGVEVVAASPAAATRVETGTSFATPFVTAAIAAAVTQRGGTPAAAVETLKARAKDLGRPGRDATFGWGLIQAEGICR